MALTYLYTGVYHIKGLSHPDDHALQLLHDETMEVEAFLTTDPTPHISEADKRSAIGSTMMKAFVGESTEASLEERIAKEMARIAGDRQETYGEGPYLVISLTGSAEAFDAGTAREFDDFVLQLGEARPDVRGEVEPIVSSLLSAVVLEAGQIVGVDNVVDALVFFREDDKPIYTYTISGSAEAVVSRPLAERARKDIAHWFSRLRDETTLDRVVRLMLGSLEEEPDRLRAFLDGWNGLEILTNKLFSSYEDTLPENIKLEDHPEPLRSNLEYLQKWNGGHLNIASKFAALAFLLSPETANEELEEFRNCKKKRDPLVHGQDVEERELPAQLTRSLTRRFLRLHLS